MQRRRLRSHSSPLLFQPRDTKQSKFCKKTILLIDWDGCLCNSMPRILTRLAIVAKELEIKYGDKINLSKEKLKALWTSEHHTHMKFVFGDFWEEANELYQKHINHMELPPKRMFQGAQEFIEAILLARLPFAIVSNASKKSINHAIKQFNWDKLLNNIPIISSDDTLYPKPHSQHFLTALKQLNVAIEHPKNYEIIVIGDGPDSDMLGAMNLAELGFEIKAIWSTLNKNTTCQLSTLDNFSDIKNFVLAGNRKGSRSPYVTTYLAK